MKGRLKVDYKVCVGCRNCEMLCTLNKEKVVNPMKSRVRIAVDEKQGIHKPMVCRHCANALCKEACAFDAFIWDDKLEIYNVDPNFCTGCGACVEACPFDAIWMSPNSQYPLKCDLCGGDPACLAQCRTLEHIGKSALQYVESKK